MKWAPTISVIAGFLALVLSPMMVANAQTTPGQLSEEQLELNYRFSLYTSLLNNPALDQALQLSDEQKTQLKTVAEQLQQDRRDVYERYQDGLQIGDNQLAQMLYADGNQELKTRFIERFEDVLLAHQIKRLHQISRQQIYRYRQWSSGPRIANTADSLDLPLQFSEEIGLTKAQASELATEIEAIRDQMEEEISKAKERAFKKVLQQLTREQQRQFDDLVGDPFDFEASNIARQREMVRRTREQAASSSDNLPDN